MSAETSKCLVCARTSQEVPLLTVHYQGQDYFICPQHFPILIHEPQKLVGLLPGAEKLIPHKD
jgi:hypothetical protein